MTTRAPLLVPLPHLSCRRQTLKKFVASGGSLLVMLGEGGEKRSRTNINYLLEEYGMTINSGTSQLVCQPELWSGSYSQALVRWQAEASLRSCISRVYLCLLLRFTGGFLVFFLTPTRL